jgi:phosphatidylserine/phosphatidylglycerophosphate/cardiolipin synthase-like enzyme
MARLDAYRFPWQSGNRVELLVDGHNFFPAMLQAIAQAHQQILLEMYLFESGQLASRFIQALCHASQRGVSVCLLLDDFGARGLQQLDRRKLQQAGVALSFYNPLHYGKWRRNLFRDHRKLLIIDGQQAFIGGTGLTDEFDAHPQSIPWHEVMLRFSGPVVSDAVQLFSQHWQRMNTAPIIPSTASPHRQWDQTARLSINAPTRMEIKRSLLRQLAQAKTRIWISTAYFIPSWKIRRRLQRAAMQGVDVRLLLPGQHTDHPAVRHAGRRYYAQLLRSGVRIFEYQPRFLHAKILLCDEWSSIGSSNIDRWNFRWNLEANLEVMDRAFSQTLVTMFEADFVQSNELHYANWHQRPWYRQLQEGFWGWIARKLERISQK